MSALEMNPDNHLLWRSPFYRHHPQSIADSSHRCSNKYIGAVLPQASPPEFHRNKAADDLSRASRTLLA